MKLHRLAAAVALWAAVLVSDAELCAQTLGASYSTIFTSGTAAPQTTAQFYSFFDPDLSLLQADTSPQQDLQLQSSPILNNAGQLAFMAALTGSGVPDNLNDTGMWSGRPGAGFSLVFREGAAAPVSSPSATYGNPHVTLPVQAEGAGAGVAFHVPLRSTITGDELNLALASTTGTTTTVTKIARKGDATPDGATYNTVAQPFMSRAGKVAFTGSTNSYAGGLWAGTPDNLILVARTGATAPGAGTASYQAIGVPSVNATGQVAYWARLNDNSRGVWSGAPDSASLLVRSGDPAPGMDPGTTFIDFRDPVMNDAGQIAIVGFTGPSGNTGIWVAQGGTLTLVARSGVTAPLAPGTNANFTGFGDARIGGGGHVTFRGHLGADQGIWSGQPGNLQLRAMTGQQAPGAASGVSFGFFGEPILNAAGQVAFFTQLTGSGVVSTNRDALYAMDPYGQVVKVLRTGDPFTVAPGDVRTLSGFTFAGASGGQDGRQVGFNDYGQLAFRGKFSGGSSGVFIARVGGPARLTTAQPMYLPADADRFGQSAPLLIPQPSPGVYAPLVIHPTSNIGYVRFTGMDPAQLDVYVLLKLEGTTQGIQAVKDELTAAGGTFGYSVSETTAGGFNLMLVYASANDGQEKTFYWNLMNIEGATLSRIAVTPEPSVPVAGAMAVGMFICRRRRRRASGRL